MLGSKFAVFAALVVFGLFIATIAILAVQVDRHGRRSSSSSSRSSSSLGPSTGLEYASSSSACGSVPLTFWVDVAGTPDLDVNTVMQGDDDGSVNNALTDAVAQPAAVGGLLNLTSSLPEAETHIASYPAASSLWIAAVSDFSLRGGYNTTKYSYSINGGTSWSEHFVPLDPVSQKPATSDGRTWQANSDPVVAFGPTGRVVYTSNLYFNATDSANGIYVASGTLPSSAGPAVWTASQVRPVVVNSSPSTTLFEDKEWLAADPVTGQLYVVWTHFDFGAGIDMIYFATSTNGGASWSAPTQVSPSWQNGAVQGSQVAVDSSGTVWVLWTTFFVNNTRRLYYSRSTTRGSTWSTVGSPVTPYFTALTFPSPYRKEAFCAAAVDQHTRTLHVAFPATASNGTSKVMYTHAANGGVSFSAPVNVVDTQSGNQFFPAIATDVSAANRVRIAWYDTRNNTAANNRQLDLYTAASTNAGATFGANARVTPAKTDVGASTFVGDYAGIASQGGVSLPAFAFFVTPMRTALLT